MGLTQIGGEYAPQMLADDGPVIALASQGDHGAQALMVDHVIACANAGLVPVVAALASAEAFARMAALSGEVCHRQKLGGVLFWQAQHCHDARDLVRCQVYQIEAVAIMSRLADEGDEHSAALLTAYAEVFDPKILKLADDLLRLESEADDLIGGTETIH